MLRGKMESTAFKPRKWQIEAKQRWEVTEKGVVKVVTGAGKTKLALMCINTYFQRHNTGVVIIIVPTISLLDQWIISVSDFLGIDSDEIGVFSGRKKCEHLQKINIFVINTARTELERLVTNDNVFLIIDECHKAGSPLNSAVLNISHNASLGLSATPEREHDQGFEKWITPSLGEIIYEYSYVDALRDGVICSFDLINIRIPLTETEDTEYMRISKLIVREYRMIQNGTGSEEKLVSLLMRRARVSECAKFRIPTAVHLYTQTSSKTIIFHEFIPHAVEIYKLLSLKYHDTVIYHSKLSNEMRYDNLRLFRRGMANCLVTCKALDEGLDVPDIGTAIISSSTASIRQRIQRLGRVLRPSPGKKEAVIFTIYATDLEEQRLIEESEKLNSIASVQWQRVSV